MGVLLKGEPPHHGDRYDIRNAQWLIRDLSFSVVLSARHYLATASIGSEREVAPRPFLGVGNPTLDAVKLASTQAFQRSIKTRNGVLDFSALPETIDELKTAGKLFGRPDSDVLLGKIGTEAALRAKPLADYDVIHFATHGLLRDDVAGLSESALLLTPGNVDDEFDNGILSASEIARLSLNARLVVLSACNTAKYDLAHASRGVQDLQAAFTIAGSPTLLGSLWPVDSTTARDMIISFFNEWRSPQNVGASEALAKATRSFLRHADDYHQHPWFWAPYLIAGNGGTLGYVKPQRATHLAAYTIFNGFDSGAEIVHAANLGADMLFTLIAEWDGKKMNGIVSRRSITGAEKWRVGSREIGIGRVATNGEAIYSTGYTTEQNPIPVFRAFDASGRLLWKTELADLRGYSFNDLVFVPNGLLLTIGSPRFSALANDRAVILALDSAGKVQLRSEIKLGEQRKLDLFDIEALIGLRSGNVVVTINNGSTIGGKPDVLFGLPLVCHSGSSTSVYEIDRRTLRTVATHSISNFRATSLMAIGEQLFIGGETLNTCSFKGVASIFHLSRSDEPRKLWQADEMFNSSVRGMLKIGNSLVVAVKHERSLGIDNPTFQGIDYSKHWLDHDALQREGSLVTLSKDGAVISEQFLSAGMGVYVQGIEMSRDGPMAYGTLGGMPWVGVIHKPTTVGKGTAEARKKKPNRKWWQFW